MTKFATRHRFAPTRRREAAGSTQEGYTLIEMLLVVVVLGILAAVVVMNLGGVAGSASVAACEANVATVQAAVSAYNVQTGGATPVTVALLTSGATPYLSSFPTSMDYAITLVNGAVMVAAPASVTPVVATGSRACAGAGASVVLSAGRPVPSTTSTTTTSTTTTTVPASNGIVIAASSNSAGNRYFGTDILRFSNAASATAITITVVVNHATGMRAGGAFNTFRGFPRVAVSTANGKITYVYRGAISPYVSSGVMAFRFFGKNLSHDAHSDTWSVTSTRGSVTATQHGLF